MLLGLEGAELVRPNDHVDVLATFEDREQKIPITVNLVQNVVVLGRGPSGRLSLHVLPEEGELLALAKRVGTLHVARRHAEDISIREGRPRISYASLVILQRRDDQRKERRAGFQKLLRGVVDHVPKGAREVTVKLQDAALVRPGDHLDILFTGTDPNVKDAITVTVLEDVVVRARHAATGKVALLVHVAEAERLVHALRLGVLNAMLRNPRDRSLGDNRRRTSRSVLKHGEHARVTPIERYSKTKRIKIIRSLPGIKYDSKPRPAARK